MADWWTISGWIGTFAFGGIGLYQFIRDHGENKVWQERTNSLFAIKKGLVQIRAMLTEAGTTERIIKTEAAHQFVSSLGHQVMTIEHHIDEMIAPEIAKRMKESDQSC